MRCHTLSYLYEISKIQHGFYTCSKSLFALTATQVYNGRMWLVLACYYCIEQHGSLLYTTKISPRPIY